MTPTELTARIDVRPLYQPFLGMYLGVLAACSAEGADFWATCGLRTPDEQTLEYLKGRETIGPNASPLKPLGDTVTRARAYFSFHQYGIATDSTRDGDKKPGLQPSWKREDYAVLVRHAEARGLRALGPIMGDWPHLELPIEKKGLSLNLLRVTMTSARTPEEGLRQVHALLDRYGPWVGA